MAHTKCGPSDHAWRSAVCFLEPSPSYLDPDQYLSCCCQGSRALVWSIVASAAKWRSMASPAGSAQFPLKFMMAIEASSFEAVLVCNQLRNLSSLGGRVLNWSHHLGFPPFMSGMENQETVYVWSLNGQKLGRNSDFLLRKQHKVANNATQESPRQHMLLVCVCVWKTLSTCDKHVAPSKKTLIAP